MATIKHISSKNAYYGAAEQAELKERLAAMQTEQEQAKAASEGVEKFMTVVRRHMNFEELTHTLLREFVEKIVVHEAEDTGSGRSCML